MRILKAQFIGDLSNRFITGDKSLFCFFHQVEMNMLLSAFTGQCFQKVAEVGGRNVELLCKICYRWYADIYQYFRIKILPDLFFKSVQKVRFCLIPGDELYPSERPILRSCVALVKLVS